MVPAPRYSARVLLVDDEVQPLELRVHIMKSRGFAVLATESPVKAIAMARNSIEKIDVAILDYDMPVMNGSALASRLRSILPELKIVLYSGAVDVPQSDMTNIDSFVSKGDGIGTLIAEITRFTQQAEESPRSFTSAGRPNARARANRNSLLRTVNKIA